MNDEQKASQGNWCRAIRGQGDVQAKALQNDEGLPAAHKAFARNERKALERSKLWICRM